MQWQDTGIVINTRKFNDNSLIMKAITENNGIYSGLVRLKKNQGGQGVKLTGNKPVSYTHLTLTTICSV